MRGKRDGRRREEVRFFNIENFWGGRWGKEEMGVRRKKWGYVEEMEILRRDLWLGRSMNMC